MKKYIILGAAALIFSMTSCDKLLDKEPLDKFADTPAYWNSADNLANQCNAFYSLYSGYDGWYYFKNLSDDQAGEAFVNWTYTNVPASDATWNNAFTTIRRANIIINGAQGSTLDDKVKNNYIGIARLNRAWQYYQLVRMYGDVQYIDWVMDINDDSKLYAARDDRDMVIDKVMEDLDFAAKHITSSGHKVFSSDLAYAMKAEVALYEGSFCKYRTQADNGKPANEERAKKYFEECVNACNYLMSRGYDLNDSYQANYNSDNLDGNPEMIFFKQYATNTYMHSVIDYTLNTSGTHGITKDAFDSFLFTDGKPVATTSFDTNDAVAADGSLAEVLKNRDKRLAALIDPVVAVKGQPYSRGGSAGFTSSTGYGVAKYDNPAEIALSDRNSIGRQATDAPLFWYSVVLLEYAEAKAELGTITQDDLNKTVNRLLKRAGVADLTLTPAADPANDMHVSNLLWEIRRCRRCELMCDNWYRYWDLIRWHQLDKLDNSKNPDIALGANLKNMTDHGQTVNAEGYMETYFGNVRKYEAKHYLYPVPSGQRTLNSKLTQNPGW